MDINQKIVEYYSQGIQPIVIADRLGMDPSHVRSKIQNLRGKGIITNYTRGRTGSVSSESTARQIYLSKGLKSGSMSRMLDQMSEDVRTYFIEKTINDGYETISEMVADILIDHYFEIVREG